MCLLWAAISVGGRPAGVCMFVWAAISVGGRPAGPWWVVMASPQLNGNTLECVRSVVDGHSDGRPPCPVCAYLCVGAVCVCLCVCVCVCARTCVCVCVHARVLVPRGVAQVG